MAVITSSEAPHTTRQDGRYLAPAYASDLTFKEVYKRFCPPDDPTYSLIPISHPGIISTFIPGYLTRLCRKNACPLCGYDRKPTTGVHTVCEGCPGADTE